MRLASDAFEQALANIVDHLDMHKIVAPLLELDTQLPVEFASCDSLLDRVQTMLKGKTSVEVWALIATFDSFERLAKILPETAELSADRTQQERKNRERHPESQHGDKILASPRLVAEYAEVTKPKVDLCALFASHALICIFTALHNAGGRYLQMIRSTQDMSALVRPPANPGTHMYVPISAVEQSYCGERFVTSTQLLEAAESLGFAEAYRNRSATGKKLAHKRQDQVYGWAKMFVHSQYKSQLEKSKRSGKLPSRRNMAVKIQLKIVDRWQTELKTNSTAQMPNFETIYRWLRKHE